VGKLTSFENQIENARKLAAEVRADADHCAAFLNHVARQFFGHGAEVGDTDFRAEEPRFQAFERRRDAFDLLLAKLVLRLEQATTDVSTELDNARSLTMREKIAGLLSRKRMWRIHADRVREAPVIGRLLDLLAQSDSLAGLVNEHRSFLQHSHRMSEADLVAIVEHRRHLVNSIDIVHIRIKELRAKALNTEGRIGLYGGRGERERLEQERIELAAEAGRMSAEEERLREASRHHERFIGMFQVFVDGLNDQIGVCNAIMRKLMIDTEERLILYRSQVGKEAQDLSSGSQPGYAHIADLMKLLDRNMLVPQELERRKSLANGAFKKRFPAFAELQREADAPAL
jgi:hypothetical protein